MGLGLLDVDSNIMLLCKHNIYVWKAIGIGFG
jgi:hypothetical protein